MDLGLASKADAEDTENGGRRWFQTSHWQMGVEHSHSAGAVWGRALSCSKMTSVPRSPCNLDLIAGRR